MSIKGGKPNDRRIVAHLMVPNGREAVDFYRRAFGAQSLYVSELPGGRIVHAQLRVEQSVLMMTEETLREGQEAPPPMEAKLASPKTLGGTTFMRARRRRQDRGRAAGDVLRRSLRHPSRSVRISLGLGGREGRADAR